MKLGGGFGAKGNTRTVTLRRDGLRTPWGIRLVGGTDVGAPIVITRAQVGSPSEGELKRGDLVRKIADYDARDLRHEDAQNLFRQAGNTISIVIERQGGNSPALSPGSATLPRARTQPLPQPRPTTPMTPLAGPVSPSVKPPVAGGVATPFALAALPSSLNRPSTPGAGGAGGAGPGYVVPSRPASAVQPPSHLTVSFPPPLPGTQPMEEDINNQPYRTTPLVLPGAKVKKDAANTESYLRHHPNPMFRAPPSHYDPMDVLMKQKVADTVLQRVVGEDQGKQVVHKQFNSPIGLYSEQNIADTIQSQTGMTPIDLERRHLRVVHSTPFVTFSSKYRTEGRLLLLSLKGDGNCKLTFENYHAIYEADFDVVKNKEDGEDYVKFKNTKLDSTTSKATYQFDNLFNRDPTLGKVTNSFLNEN